MMGMESMSDMMMMGMKSDGMGSDMMMGGGWAAPLGWILMAALVVVALLLLWRFLRRGANARATSGLITETPFAALQRRFALGEINPTEFGAMQQQLAAK